LENSGLVFSVKGISHRTSLWPWIKGELPEVTQHLWKKISQRLLQQVDRSICAAPLCKIIHSYSGTMPWSAGTFQFCNYRGFPWLSIFGRDIADNYNGSATCSFHTWNLMVSLRICRISSDLNYGNSMQKPKPWSSGRTFLCFMQT